MSTPAFGEVLAHLWGNVDDNEQLESLLQDIAMGCDTEATRNDIRFLLQRAERELITEQSGNGGRAAA